MPETIIRKSKHQTLYKTLSIICFVFALSVCLGNLTVIFINSQILENIKNAVDGYVNGGMVVSSNSIIGAWLKDGKYILLCGACIFFDFGIIIILLLLILKGFLYGFTCGSILLSSGGQGIVNVLALFFVGGLFWVSAQIFISYCAIEFILIRKNNSMQKRANRLDLKKKYKEFFIFTFLAFTFCLFGTLIQSLIAAIIF